MIAAKRIYYGRTFKAYCSIISSIRINETNQPRNQNEKKSAAIEQRASYLKLSVRETKAHRNVKKKGKPILLLTVLHRNMQKGGVIRRFRISPLSYKQKHPVRLRSAVAIARNPSGSHNKPIHDLKRAYITRQPCLSQTPPLSTLHFRGFLHFEHSVLMFQWLLFLRFSNC